MTSIPIFITGTGTDVGKTLASAIITEALEADYWKPVQAGFDNGTDAFKVKSLISNNKSVIHGEAYELILPASPHIAAREEDTKINLDVITNKFKEFKTDNPYIVIEGAGGIMVPLNEKEFIMDLILQLHAKVVLVSRNYLGSINHSLLTAALCKQRQLSVVGWLFNDHYMNYEKEIVDWSGYPEIGCIPFMEEITKAFVREEALKLKPRLLELL